MWGLGPGAWAYLRMYDVVEMARGSLNLVRL